MAEKRMHNLKDEIIEIENLISEEYELLKNDLIKHLEQQLKKLYKEKRKLKHDIKKEKNTVSINPIF